MIEGLKDENIYVNQEIKANKHDYSLKINGFRKYFIFRKIFWIKKKKILH